MDNNKELDELYLDDKSRGELYFNILSKSTTYITWLILTLLIFSGTNVFIFYRWYLGNIPYAIEREQNNQKHLDDLYKKVKQTDYFINKNLPDSINEKTLETAVQNKIISLQQLDGEGLYSTLPFIGINFFITDYVVVLLIIGLILLFWQYRIFKFSKDVLKEYFNYPQKLNQIYSELISNLFFSVLPSGEKDKRYKQFEFIIVVYILSILLIFGSNIYDVFVKESRGYSLSIFEQPGFIAMLPHIIVTNLIILACLSTTIYVYIKYIKYLRDIRNLIILIKWDKKALAPAFYYLFNKNGRELVKGGNLVEYRRLNDTNNLYLCITLTEKKTPEEFYQIYGMVNLPESLKLYSQNHPREIKKLEFDSFLNRKLTDEEQYMRDYFEKLFTDDSYEKSLCEMWKSQTKIT
jgi:hypothetical protein